MHNRTCTYSLSHALTLDSHSQALALLRSHTRTHAHTCAYMHMNTRMSVCMHSHALTLAHICTHSHAYMHALTRTHALTHIVLILLMLNFGILFAIVGFYRVQCSEHQIIQKVNKSLHVLMKECNFYTHFFRRNDSCTF